MDTDLLNMSIVFVTHLNYLTGEGLFWEDMTFQKGPGLIKNYIQLEFQGAIALGHAYVQNGPLCWSLSRIMRTFLLPLFKQVNKKTLPNS